MGQKIHPIGFRVGITKDWKSNWFNKKQAPTYIAEDKRVRDLIHRNYRGAGIAEVNIERPTDDRISIVIRTARPGIIIGRGGSEVDQLQRNLEILTDRTIKISIHEVEHPNLEAPLVAQDLAFQMESRVPINRAMKETVQRVMESGAQGVKLRCSGRLGGSDIARSVEQRRGRIPLQTIRADIDYGFAEARTKYGPIGIKAWVFRGEILPEEISEAQADTLQR
ncbi:MAG: 30S ribosomal protein S3 [Candidatus Bipolaricaulia bacterium]